MPVSTVSANVKPSVSSTASKLSAKDKDEDILFNNSAKQSTVKSNDKSDKTIVDYVMDFFDGIVDFFTGSKNNKKDNESKTDETKKTDDISKSDETKKSDKTTSATVKSEIEAPSGDGKTGDKKTNEKKSEPTCGENVVNYAESHLGKNIDAMKDSGMDIPKCFTNVNQLYWCAGFVSHCMNIKYGENTPQWYKDLKNSLNFADKAEEEQYYRNVQNYPDTCGKLNNGEMSEDIANEKLDELDDIQANLYDKYAEASNALAGTYPNTPEGMAELQKKYIEKETADAQYREAFNEYNAFYIAKEIYYGGGKEWLCQNVWDAAPEDKRVNLVYNGDGDSKYFPQNLDEQNDKDLIGDMILFNTERSINHDNVTHIGFIEKVERNDNGEITKIYTVEGNTEKAAVVGKRTYVRNENGSFTTEVSNSDNQGENLSVYGIIKLD